MALEDRLRRIRIGKLPHRRTPTPALPTVLDDLNMIGNRAPISPEYIDELTRQLLAKYELSPAQEDLAPYRAAVQWSAEEYLGLLRGAHDIDRMDRILAATSILEYILPGFGHAIDAIKDVMEFPFKIKHGVKHYLVQPLRRGDNLQIGRFATLAGLEMASFIPHAGAAVDILSIYGKMAEDTVITDAYNTVNPANPAPYDSKYFIRQTVTGPFKLPGLETRLMKQ